MIAAWALGIAASVLIVALADIAMPEGEVKKYIKGIAALLIVAAVLQPLPALIRGETADALQQSYSDSEDRLSPDATYLAEVERKNDLLRIDVCKRKLRAEGVDNVSIAVIGAGEGKLVTVDLSAAFLPEGASHINMDETIRSTVCSVFGIGRSQTLITGGNYEVV